MRSQRPSELNSPGNTTFLLPGLTPFLRHGVRRERPSSPVHARARLSDAIRFVADVLQCTGERERTPVARLCPFLFKCNYSCVNRTETPAAEPHY